MGIKKPLKVSKELLKKWILMVCITLEIFHSIPERLFSVGANGFFFSFQEYIQLPLGQCILLIWQHGTCMAILVNMPFS